MSDTFIKAVSGMVPHLKVAASEAVPAGAPTESALPPLLKELASSHFMARYHNDFDGIKRWKVYTLSVGPTAFKFFFPLGQRGQAKTVKQAAMLVRFMFARLGSKLTTVDIALPFVAPPRVMPQTGNVRDASVINGGSTVTRGLRTGVIVWRREEWFKVLAHELGHVCGPRVPRGMRRRLVARSKSLLPYEGTHDPDEAYVETWARLIALAAAEALRSRGKKGLVRRIRSMQQFSRFQAAKVLHCWAHDGGGGRSSRYKENTHAISYYVIAAACCACDGWLKASPRPFLDGSAFTPQSERAVGACVKELTKRLGRGDDKRAACYAVNDGTPLGRTLRMTLPEPLLQN